MHKPATFPRCSHKRRDNTRVKVSRGRTYEVCARCSREQNALRVRELRVERGGDVRPSRWKYKTEGFDVASIASQEVTNNG